METIIAILFYFGIAISGTDSTTQAQFDGIQSSNQNQTNCAQMSTGNSDSGNGNIVINDNDKDN